MKLKTKFLSLILLAALFVTPTMISAQTYSFECFCGWLANPDCGCTGNVNGMFFDGLLIKTSGKTVGRVLRGSEPKFTTDSKVQFTLDDGKALVIDRKQTGFTSNAAYKSAIQSCLCQSTPSAQLTTITAGSGPITVTGTGTSYVINNTDTDTDPTNELQALSLNGLTLTLSGANSVMLPSHAPITADDTQTIDVTTYGIDNQTFSAEISGWAGAPVGTMPTKAVGGGISYIAPLTIYGDFLNDASAGSGGVPVGGMYELIAGNPYGLPAGTPRIRQ